MRAQYDWEAVVKKTANKKKKDERSLTWMDYIK